MSRAPFRLQKKVRRILMALHIADRPLTGADLVRITCHWTGAVYPALDRLESNGWIERHPGDVPAYQLTARGRQAAGLQPPTA